MQKLGDLESEAVHFRACQINSTETVQKVWRRGAETESGGVKVLNTEGRDQFGTEERKEGQKGGIQRTRERGSEYGWRGKANGKSLDKCSARIGNGWDWTQAPLARAGNRAMVA